MERYYCSVRLLREVETIMQTYSEEEIKSELLEISKKIGDLVDRQNKLLLALPYTVMENMSGEVFLNYYREKPKWLELQVPVLPPHRKHIRSDNSAIRELWHSVIRYAVNKHRQLLEGFKPFSKSVGVITIVAPDNRIRDVDNYIVTFVNNALVENGLLLDDEFSVYKFLLEGCYTHNKFGWTRVRIFDFMDLTEAVLESDSYINCHNCQLRRVFLA